ncbi:MAG: phospholipase [Acidimicrobiia bacterium]
MSHVHVTEAPLGPSSGASVVADIGGDVGAGVLYVPETLAGHEMEIRRCGGAWDGTHTGVRERIGESAVWAAFFGSLAAGQYEVRVRDHGSRAIELEVRGGEVTEARW